MTKDILEARIKELSEAITEHFESCQKVKAQLDNMVNHHNVLVGRLEETKEMYKKFDTNEAANPVTVDVLPVI